MSDPEHDLSLRWVGWLNPHTNVLHSLKLSADPPADWQKIYVNDATHIAQLEHELAEAQREIRRDEYDRDNATAAVRWHERERARLLAELEACTELGEWCAAERDEAREGWSKADRLRLEESDEYDEILSLQLKLLTGVADALKGEPRPLRMHDHSDLPAVAAHLVTERDELRAGMAEVLGIVRAYQERRSPEGAQRLAELLATALPDGDTDG